MKSLSLAVAALVGLTVSAHAGDLSAADEIRAGRAALETDNPEKARASFEAALSNSGLSQGDRFAALIGLGRAEIWLGEYPAAVATFREALKLAQNDADVRAARTGLAKALNANEDDLEAYSLVAPLAPGALEPTVEALRSEKALGWEDRSADLIAAIPAENIQGHLGAEFASLKSDMDFALSDRVDGAFAYSDDSDGLDIAGYGLGAWIPGPPGGDVFESLRVASNVWTIDQAGVNDTLYSFDVGSHLRIGDAQHADINLGGASVGSWDFFEGNADWDYRFDDTYGVNASIERAPILTTAALAARDLLTTYDAGVSIRPLDHLYVYPAYFIQDFTDGNERNGASLRVVLSPYDIPDTATAIGAQVFARDFHSSVPSTGLYFNPADYNQTQVDLIAVHRFNEDWLLRILAGGGYESVDGTVEPSYELRVSLFARLPGNGRAEFHYDRNSFASFAGGGSGYWINTISLSLAYPIGL